MSATTSIQHIGAYWTNYYTDSVLHSVMLM